MMKPTITTTNKGTSLLIDIPPSQPQPQPPQPHPPLPQEPQPETVNLTTDQGVTYRCNILRPSAVRMRAVRPTTPARGITRSSWTCYYYHPVNNTRSYVRFLQLSILALILALMAMTILHMPNYEKLKHLSSAPAAPAPAAVARRPELTAPLACRPQHMYYTETLAAPQDKDQGKSVILPEHYHMAPVQLASKDCPFSDMKQQGMQLGEDEVCFRQEVGLKQTVSLLKKQPSGCFTHAVRREYFYTCKQADYKETQVSKPDSEAGQDNKWLIWF